MRFFIVFLFLLEACAPIQASGQTPRISSHQYILGDTSVLIVVSNYGPGVTMLALHENENTSVLAAKQILASTGGTLVELRHTGERYLSFESNGVRYRFDPNRIYTASGITGTLGETYTPEAHTIVASFAANILQHAGSGPIVALHNNTNNRYSVISYQSGGVYVNDSSRLHIQPNTDIDNFFFVTSNILFTSLSTSGYSVVQQSLRPQDDGSLSVYCASAGIPYINVEAQHGNTVLQEQMLRYLLGTFD